MRPTLSTTSRPTSTRTTLWPHGRPHWLRDINQRRSRVVQHSSITEFYLPSPWEFTAGGFPISQLSVAPSPSPSTARNATSYPPKTAQIERQGWRLSRAASYKYTASLPKMERPHSFHSATMVLTTSRPRTIPCLEHCDHTQIEWRSWHFFSCWLNPSQGCRFHRAWGTQSWRIKTINPPGRLKMSRSAAKAACSLGAHLSELTFRRFS